MLFWYRVVCILAVLILAEKVICTWPNNKESAIFLKIDNAISIDEAISITLSNNPAVAVKKSEVKKTQFEAQEKKGMLFPSLSSNYYLSTGNSGNILSSSQGVTPQSYMSVQSKSFYDLNFTLMFPLFTGGSFNAMAEEAKLTAKWEESLLGALENEVIFKTIELYYKALYAKEYILVTDEWRKLVEAQLNRTKSLLEAGKVPKADLLRDEAELALVSQNQREALTAKENAILDLKAHLGISMDSKLSLKSEFHNSQINRITQEEAVNYAFKNRPELMAIQHRLNSAKANIKAANGAFLPQVSLMGMYDVFRSTTMKGENGFTVGLVTSIPIYDGGIRSSKTKQAETEVDKVLAMEKEIKLRIENEVRQAILQLETASQNITTTEAAIKSAEEYLRITGLRHEAGKAIKVEVYDSILTHVRAELNRLRALYDMNIAKAKLKLSTATLLYDTKS